MYQYIQDARQLLGASDGAIHMMEQEQNSMVFHSEVNTVTMVPSLSTIDPRTIIYYHEDGRIYSTQIRS